MIIKIAESSFSKVSLDTLRVILRSFSVPIKEESDQLRGLYFLFKKSSLPGFSQIPYVVEMSMETGLAVRNGDSAIDFHLTDGMRIARATEITNFIGRGISILWTKGFTLNGELFNYVSNQD